MSEMPERLKKIRDVILETNGCYSGDCDHVKQDQCNRSLAYTYVNACWNEMQGCIKTLKVYAYSPFDKRLLDNTMSLAREELKKLGVTDE